MQGSTWPTAADTFATINEGTTAFTASLLMELALAIEALELAVGANPYDFRTTHGYSSAFTSYAGALKRRMRMEIGLVDFSAGALSRSVTFTASRFSATPTVVVQRYGASAPRYDQCYEVGNVTTSGFDCFRANNTSGAENCRYLAVQVPT